MACPFYPGLTSMTCRVAVTRHSNLQLPIPGARIRAPQLLPDEPLTPFLTPTQPQYLVLTCRTQDATGATPPCPTPAAGSVRRLRQGYRLVNRRTIRHA